MSEWRTNRRTKRRFRMDRPFPKEYFRSSGPEYHINPLPSAPHPDTTVHGRNIEGSVMFYDPESDTLFFNELDKGTAIKGLRHTLAHLGDDTIIHEYLHRWLAANGVPVAYHHKIIFRMLYGAKVESKPNPKLKKLAEKL